MRHAAKAQSDGPPTENGPVAHAIGVIMAESTRRHRRQVKVDVPPEVKAQLKHEAVELDIPLKQYFGRILDYRLPWAVMDKLDEKGSSRVWMARPTC
jgi:hypothetical protein